MEEFNFEDFSAIKAGEVFARGITTNDKCGIYMTDNRYGDPMLWIAKKGGNNDWSIYVSFISSTEDHAIKHGQKVTFKPNILKLVPCSNDMFIRYRY